MTYILYAFLILIAVFILRFIKKYMIGKSMKNDIFNHSASLGDAKWWSASDGRLLLPVLYNEVSSVLYLLTNDNGTKWNIARVTKDFTFEDISEVYPHRYQAIRAAEILQKQGELKVCYATAKAFWIEAVNTGGTL